MKEKSDRSELVLERKFKNNRANQIKIQDFFNLIFGMKIQISELAIK